MPHERVRLAFGQALNKTALRIDNNLSHSSKIKMADKEFFVSHQVVVKELVAPWHPNVTNLVERRSGRSHPGTCWRCEQAEPTS